MSKPGPTYEQAPAYFEAARQWQAIAETATTNAAQASLRVAPFDTLARAMFERHAREASILAATLAAQGIAALAQPPARFTEGDLVQIGGAPFVVTRVTPGSLAVEEDSVQARERLIRQRWKARILARLDNPTEDDRTEAAEMAAWLRRTLGDVLPLP